MLAALCGSVSSCAEAGPPPVSVFSQGIVGGEPSSPEQDGVVLLRAELDDGSELLCSASLVGPNLLLTARHCVSYLSEGQFSCTVRGELIDNPSGGGRLGLHLPAESLEIYGGKTPRKAPLAHGQQIISTLSPTICKNDLAFVVLDAALDLPLVPMRLGRSALAHETALLVGYGLDGVQRVIDYRTQPRAQKRDLEIEAVGPDSISDGVTTVPPRSLILDGPSGCVGDSGGPLLAQETGAILGVYSLQQGESCAGSDVRHRLTHVPPFQTLIDEAFAAAGCEPLLEDVPSSGNAGAPSAAGASAEAGADGEPSGAGGADATNAAGSPSATPEAERAHSSSCGFAEPAGSRGSVSVLALLASAALLQRRRKHARSGR